MSSKRFGRLYQDFATILLNTVLLFLLINFVAAWWLQSEPSANNWKKKRFPRTLITYPVDYISSLDDPSNLLYKVYPGYDQEELLALLQLGLRLTDHPTLGAMVRPGESGAFHVGIEGVRYDSVVGPENIDSLLHNQNAVWCLGGSTIYGHKIGSAETLSFHLTTQDSSRTYLNLGVPSYHQTTEVNKLIILLKKGYRPDKVLFLDGNNDFLGQRYSNFHPAEIPNRANMAYPQTTNLDIHNKQRSSINWHLLPILKLVRRMTRTNAPVQQSPGRPFENLNDPNAIYFLPNKNKHYRSVRSMPCDSLIAFFPMKIFETFRMNQQFVDKLANAYDFEYEFLFQPLGFLNGLCN